MAGTDILRGKRHGVARAAARPSAARAPGAARRLARSSRRLSYPPKVGEGKKDHNFWRRAEDVKETRAVFVCDPSKPGTDVAAAMAGALAATAVAFKGRDPGYAQQCVDKAKTLYE